MFVVKNLREYNLIKKNKKKIYIENFILYLQLKNKNKVKYFYSSLDKIKNNFQLDFFSNWFKSNYKEKSNNIELVQCFQELSYTKLYIT